MPELKDTKIESEIDESIRQDREGREREADCSLFAKCHDRKAAAWRGYSLFRSSGRSFQEIQGNKKIADARGDNTS